MYRITNTAFNRAKEHLHRVAPKFDPEPDFGGRRLRRGETLEITDAHYERVKDMLAIWEKTGVADVVQISIDVGEVSVFIEPEKVSQEIVQERVPEETNEETGAGSSPIEEAPTSTPEIHPPVETMSRKGPGKKKLF